MYLLPSKRLVSRISVLTFLFSSQALVIAQDVLFEVPMACEQTTQPSILQGPSYDDLGFEMDFSDFQTDSPEIATEGYRIQTTELKVATVGNSLGILTPWHPDNRVPTVEDFLFVAFEAPVPQGDIFAELGNLGQALGVLQDPGVYRFDLKSLLTPGLHRIRFRWTDPQLEPHSHFVSRPMWIALKHSQPNDPVVRNLHAMARRSLSSTARQEFERQYSSSLSSLDRLLKEPFEDTGLTDKVDQILDRRAPKLEGQMSCEQDVWPLPPAIPYCQCMPEVIEYPIPVTDIPATQEASSAPTAKPAPPVSQESPVGESTSPTESATPADNSSSEEPKAYYENRRSGPHQPTHLVLAKRPNQDQIQAESVVADRLDPPRLHTDIATESNRLLGELERMQARSEQACRIAAYLEAQELLQDRTMKCLTAKKVVSTVEFDTPAIFAATTLTGDRNGATIGDLTILEGMKLDVYGDGRYALTFKYLRPSKPVTLHLQMQCWIDEDSGWKTLTLPPISIDPGRIDPKDQMKEYSYSGHSRALERSSGYLQKVRRTGSALTGYGLNNPSDLRSY